MTAKQLFNDLLEPSVLQALYEKTYARTHDLIVGLSAEDMTAQSMEEASPVKWHLAHTAWFFEEFVLREEKPDWISPDARFGHLFNSYYAQVGPRFTRHQRGLLTRPGVEAVLAYRCAIDEAMREKLPSKRLRADLVELGCHHEMQHQELLLTDLLHLFSHNPTLPVYRAPEPKEVKAAVPLHWETIDAGRVSIGHVGAGFCYDNELPRHEVLLQPFKLASRPVTNGEFLAFMRDGGYENETVWLMDGYSTAKREGWCSPAYWWQQDGQWLQFSLRGAQPVDEQAAVCHISYYEADAYARWAGKRLPTEQEWEVAASNQPVRGNFQEQNRLRPNRAQGAGLTQLYGDVWEWTRSAYAPYPGYQPPAGAVGEYNGKFMVNQYVLKGGSCLTPERQLRTSYRNFFYPHHRWQMAGLRLAEDI